MMGAVGWIDYPSHPLHGAAVTVSEARASLRYKGLELGPVVRIELRRGRRTLNFWLPPGRLRMASA